MKSSLAQQNQVSNEISILSFGWYNSFCFVLKAPPRKTEQEIREDEDLELALALSQSEAEAKEKEKMRATSAYFKQEPVISKPAVSVADRTPSPEHPELARYLNRPYWENRPLDTRESTLDISAASPPVQATAPYITNSDTSLKENGVVDIELEEFVHTLKTQVEIFINRMKSNSSRGRSIANDSSVQTLFMNITAMHSKLLKYIQQHDDSRLYYERLQDKLTQVKDARAALDALREEHREKLRRQAEEAELQRQMLMAHKLEIMRKKKQEYLQYQRQLALQRIQEQEREMHMRKEQQKQQYMMGPGQYYIGSPVHAGQYAQHPQHAQHQQHAQHPQHAPQSQHQSYAAYPPPGMMYAPHAMGGMPRGMQPGAQSTQGAMMPQSPMNQQGPPQAPPQAMMSNHAMMPPGGMAYAPQIPQQQQHQPHPQQNMQPGAPPASPQMPKDESTATGELISFLD